MAHSPESGHAPAEERVEQFIGGLLRIGVMIAAAVAALGGAAYLARHGAARADYSVFHGQPEMLSTLGGILAGVTRLDPRAIVQLGIVLLIATPVARVAFTLIAFGIRRDARYVLISGIVLALLIYSLLAG